MKNFELDGDWAEYLACVKCLEQAVKLTCFWTLKTAKSTREAAYYTQVTADKVREVIKEIE